MHTNDTVQFNSLSAIQAELFPLQDAGYKAFNAKLIPTVPPETMIGIRVPALRSFAKRFFKVHRAEALLFIEKLPHHFFEENNLHAFFIECLEDIDPVLSALESFLPYIDNWQTCDLCSPPILKKHPVEVYRRIQRWIQAPHGYTVRYAIGILLSNYLDAQFQPEMLSMAAHVQHDDYYVNMMIAWYFATALVKQYAAAVPYLEEQRLSPFVHNKTIQKAVESRCITPEIKAYLKTLKRR